jgi:hypothetical protein
MRTLIVAMLLAAPLLALGEDQAAAQGGAITVVGMKLGTGVQDKEIQGEADAFKPDVGRVYCWAKTSGGEGTDLTYAWYKADQKMSEVKVALKYASMRTWSYKTITADMKGDWRVDLVGSDGNVLKSVSFKVGD